MFADPPRVSWIQSCPRLRRLPPYQLWSRPALRLHPQSRCQPEQQQQRIIAKARRNPPPCVPGSRGAHNRVTRLTTVLLLCRSFADQQQRPNAEDEAPKYTADHRHRHNSRINRGRRYFCGGRSEWWRWHSGGKGRCTGHRPDRGGLQAYEEDTIDGYKDIYRPTRPPRMPAFLTVTVQTYNIVRGWMEYMRPIPNRNSTDI